MKNISEVSDKTKTMSRLISCATKTSRLFSFVFLAPVIFACLFHLVVYLQDDSESLLPLVEKDFGELRKGFQAVKEKRDDRSTGSINIGENIKGCFTP